MRVEAEAFVVVALARHDAPLLQRRADRLHSPFLLEMHADGATLICRETEWHIVGRGLHSAVTTNGFRMVTLDAAAPAAEVGRLVRERVAAVGVETRSVPTFHRDHFLVHAGDLDRALNAVDELLREASVR